MVRKIKELFSKRSNRRKAYLILLILICLACLLAFQNCANIKLQKKTVLSIKPPPVEPKPVPEIPTAPNTPPAPNPEPSSPPAGGGPGTGPAPDTGVPCVPGGIAVQRYINQTQYFRAYPEFAPLPPQPYPPGFCYLGRYLDSTYITNIDRLPIYPLRAQQVKLAPGKNRIFSKSGSAIFGYDIPSFIKRIRNKTELMNVGEGLFRVNARGWGPERATTGLFEVFLRYDSWFTGTAPGSKWYNVAWSNQSDATGAQGPLTDFDLDDRGYVYLNGRSFGWGLSKETSEQGSSQMTDVSYMDPQVRVNPHNDICALKDGPKYYAILYGGQYQFSPIQAYDVTNPSTPVSVNIVKRDPFRCLQISDGLVGVMGTETQTTLEIYKTSVFINGGAPIFSLPDVRDFATDGTNIYALKKSSDTETLLITINPSGSSYSTSQILIDSKWQYLGAINYGAGYLTVLGGGMGQGRVLRVFNIRSGSPVELPTNGYFESFRSRYGYVPHLPLTVTVEGIDYMIVPNHSTGDVYQISGVKK